MTGSSFFEADTAILPAGDGAWTADLHPRWNVGDKPNGGYLMAIAARALVGETGRPEALTLTAHFLSPPVTGPIRVETETVKAGRSFTTAAAALVQEGRERVRVAGIFGDLSERRGPTRVTAEMPVLPPPERCRSLADLSAAAGRRVPEALNRYDLLLPPGSPWGRPGEGEPFEITGWIRFADGAGPDTLSLLTFSDAFPPTLLGTAARGWVPTLELTVHVRGRPAPGWLTGTFRTRVLVDGLLEEDGELWDSEGRPVALSRQLAMVLDRA